MAKHLFIATVVLVVMVVGMLYPFLPGRYDAMAIPVSLLIQVFGIVALPMSLLGLVWMVFPVRRKLLIGLTKGWAFFMMLVLIILAYFQGGLMMAIIAAILFAIFFLRGLALISALEVDKANVVPIYFMVVPIGICLIQLLVATPLTSWSRDRAIRNAEEYINDLEGYKARQGAYPMTVQAMYKDYSPGVVGVERYHYLPFRASYNLSFEQPRFLLDIPGTKEWVVYNPVGEQRVYSHTSWFLLLSPDELERSQGWYHSGSTGHRNWKYFYFD